MYGPFLVRSNQEQEKQVDYQKMLDKMGCFIWYKDKMFFEMITLKIIGVWPTNRLHGYAGLRLYTSFNNIFIPDNRVDLGNKCAVLTHNRVKCWYRR